MCIAVPCKILELSPEKKTAIGDFLGIKREVNIQLLSDVQVNDYVIVHVGYAIQKIEPEKALESIKTFKEYEEFENLI
jgi:hydrogenase expression/formation protein HypC